MSDKLQFVAFRKKQPAYTIDKLKFVGHALTFKTGCIPVTIR